MEIPYIPDKSGRGNARDRRYGGGTTSCLRSSTRVPCVFPYRNFGEDHLVTGSFHVSSEKKKLPKKFNFEWEYFRLSPHEKRREGRGLRSRVTNITVMSRTLHVSVRVTQLI